MKITYILPGFSFYDGCIHNRNYQPALKLKDLGHDVGMTVLNPNFDREKLLAMDLVVFSRYYPMDLSPLVLFLKRNNIKMVYETDDDLINIPPTNPTKNIIEQFLESVHMLASTCDLITTTVPYFAKQLEKRYKTPVTIIPNAIDFNEFTPRLRQAKRLQIGWSGGVTHCVDLSMVLDIIPELQEKYEFDFVINGVSANPIEAQAFDWEKSCELGLANPKDPFMEQGLLFVRKFLALKNKTFYPFYPTVMYPGILNKMDLDIAIAPVSDDVFSRSKSCLKYYEYSAVESLTIASNVIPYNTEITHTECLVENSPKEWKERIEMFIKDKKLRDKTQKEQTEWTRENRDIKKIVKLWEKAFEGVIGV